jgi:hypothetical protein
MKEKILKSREELIDKVKRQAGYVDMVDAFRICSVFTDLFGVDNFDRTKSGNSPVGVEEQLVIMWDKIERYEDIITKPNYVNPDEAKKVCYDCGEEKFLSDFQRDRKKKDGRKINCKVCSVEKQRLYIAMRLEKDPEYINKNNAKYRKNNKNN